MTDKQKNIGSGIAFLLMQFLCYQFAIKNTLEQKTKYDDYQKEALMFKDAPRQLSMLKQKEVYYDSLLTKYQLNGSSIQNSLLKVLNTSATENNFKVVSFLESHTIESNGLKANTYEFVLEGGYNAILSLIHELEQNTKFGEITHLHFEKKKNFRTGRYFLQARVLLRSFG